MAPELVLGAPRRRQAVPTLGLGALVGPAARRIGDRVDIEPRVVARWAVAHGVGVPRGAPVAHRRRRGDRGPWRQLVLWVGHGAEGGACSIGESVTVSHIGRGSRLWLDVHSSRWATILVERGAEGNTHPIGDGTTGCCAGKDSQDVPRVEMEVRLAAV